MKLDCNFKGANRSKKLVQMSEDRIDKLNHFDFPIEKAHLTFQKNKHLRQLEVVVWCEEKSFKAIAISETFIGALDGAIEKIGRQLAKFHSKMANKHRPEHSKHGKLLQLKSTLEFQPRLLKHRKNGRAA